jgi:sulfur relay (sulfurtransferase) DsrF/TusC family protein
MRQMYADTAAHQRPREIQRMKVGICAPYLNTYGGGEKYICTLAKILNENFTVVFLFLKILMCLNWKGD